VTPPAAAEPAPLYSARYTSTVTLLLMAAYTFNSMDRSIVSIIGQAMKVDLKLSDAELGQLGGTAFALLYALGSIPIARLAERFNRVNIIALALICWSGLTALLGTAASFAQLVAIRVGIGIAESGCSPPAHSLLSDYVPAERRASALSIYSCGISLGYIAGAVIGGYVVLHAGWRVACAVVGLPGIAMALVIKLCVREPPRGYSERGGTRLAAAAAAVKPASLRSEIAELAAVARLLLQWPVLNVILGVTIGSFAAYGSWAFVPPYFIRVFALDYSVIGLVSALAGGVAVGLGIFAGGFVADYFAARSKRWYALVPAIGTAIAAPLYVLAFQQADWRTSVLILAVAGFFHYASLGPTFGIVQNVVDTRRRATATALLFVCLGVLALGGGPWFTGWAIDRFAALEFQVLLGPAAESMAHADSFRAACPGGQAPAGAGAAVQAACTAALSHATRLGLATTCLFYVWSAIHYLLASFGIGRVLDAAARDNAARAAAG
jgi:predicted MFS family arabinose efflux permease